MTLKICHPVILTLNFQFTTLFTILQAPRNHVSTNAHTRVHTYALIHELTNPLTTDNGQLTTNNLKHPHGLENFALKMNLPPKSTLSIVENGSTIVQDIDDYLIQQFVNGDRMAFSHLVSRHKQTIYQFILARVGNRDMAADLTQDVFVKLLNSARQYRATGKFRSWLFRIAQNLWIDAHRKQKRATIVSLHQNVATGDNEDTNLVDYLEDGTTNPADAAEFLELQDIVKCALDALPEKQRTCLILYQYHGLSYKEIAASQDCPVGTVKSRIHTALIQVRKVLKEKEII